MNYHVFRSWDFLTVLLRDPPLQEGTAEEGMCSGRSRSLRWQEDMQSI